MTNRISTGKSVIGNKGSGAVSQKAESKLNSLAMLLESEDNFKDMFATKHQEKKKEDRPKAFGNKKVDHIENLLA